jgi:hypothetical protein
MGLVDNEHDRCLDCGKIIYSIDEGFPDGVCPQCFLNYQLDLERDW